jgi:hypothetical protein
VKNRELGSKLRTLPAQTVMLKLQTADFKLRTQSHALSDPPPLAARSVASPPHACAARGRPNQVSADRLAVFLFLDAGRGDPDDLLDERRFARPPNMRSIKSAPDSAAPR